MQTPTSPAVRRAALLLTLLALVALAAATAARSATAGPPTALRLSGDTPVDTALAVSQVTFDDAGASGTTAAHAVIGRDDAFADTLAAGPLLSAGPLLYVPGGGAGTLPDAVAAELQRILPPGAAVYVVGGTVAVSQAVEDAITDLGYLAVRLAGEERTTTAAAIAAEAAAYHGDPATVLLAAAGGWPDAIAGAAYAASESGADGAVPILLTDGTALSDAAAAFLQAHPDAEVLVLGGTAVIADAVADAAGADDRLAGDTRADTALAIEGRFPDDVTGATVVQGFADDGWVEGNAAAALLRPLLLNGPSADEVNPPTAAGLSGRLELTVVGATDRISDAGMAAAAAARGR